MAKVTLTGKQYKNMGTNLCGLKWGWVPLSIDPRFPNSRFGLHFYSNKKIKYLPFRTLTNQNFATEFWKQKAATDFGLKTRCFFWLNYHNIFIWEEKNCLPEKF